MINAGNPSAHNLKIRKSVGENKQSSAQIFEKLSRRGRLNPAQNAMSAQLTNEQLLRFYIKETAPKLEFNNDDIQGQGGDSNSVLMSEIQRLIDVGNFNAEDAKGNVNNMQTNLMNNANARQTNLITQLQAGFSSVNDSIADNLMIVKSTVDDIADNLAIYASTNDASSQSIITSLNDLNTKLEEYNTTGTVSQGALFASLANLQTALANSNTNNAANTAAIDNLSIILGSMGSVPGIGFLPPAPTPAATTTTTAAAAAAAAGGSTTPTSPGASTPPPPPFTPISATLLAAIGGLGAVGGGSTTTTDPATGITTTNVAVSSIAPTAQELADAADAAAAVAGAKGGANSVMVSGPKMAVSVGNYPEYDAIMAKNGGKPLVIKDYREILNQVAEDYPHLFPGIKKVSTYINSRSKPDLIELAEKVLKQKYEYINEQDQSANLIQNILRGHKGRGVVSGIQAERATATDIVIKALRGERKQIQEDKFRSIIQAAAPILRQNQQEAMRRQIMRDAHLNPTW